MNTCKSDYDVRYISLCLLATGSGWELSVFHVHTDQEKIRCLEDRYQHLTADEAISLALDVAATLCARQDHHGVQLGLLS